MIYYNEEGKQIEFKKDNNKFINNGYCASIYKYDSEKAIKIYNSNCSRDYRISINIFQEIQNIQSDNLIEILNIFFKQDIEKDLENIHTKNSLLNRYKIMGYLMKYYKQTKANILETDIEYMLKNMYQLENLFDTFTKKSILLEDIKASNVILEENNIVLIDPDLFKKVNYSYNTLNIINKQKLLILFKSLFDKHYKSIENEIPNFTEINDSLFDVNLENDTDITKKISKRLHKLKYPIDYFYKK